MDAWHALSPSSCPTTANDGACTKARLVEVKREVGEDNPFVAGTQGVQNYFTVMEECATAGKLRSGAK
jgi:hypothetical protein